MSLSLAARWETLGLSVVVLIVCAVLVGFVVLLQHGMAHGLPRQRQDRAFDAFDREWRGLSEALIRRRAGEAVRRFRAAVSGWFYWQNLTGVGRVGTAVVSVLAAVSLILLLINLALLLIALVRFF